MYKKKKVKDPAGEAVGKSGRTTPKVTLTPYDPELKPGETVEIGASKSRQIKKPNRPMKTPTYDYGKGRYGNK